VRLTLTVIGTLVFSASVFYAQQISGTITGVVKDSQQAAVANAKITVTSQDKGTTRDGLTGTDGSFVFTQLQPGGYTISVEAIGGTEGDQPQHRGGGIRRDHRVLWCREDYADVAPGRLDPARYG